MSKTNQYDIIISLQTQQKLVLLASVVVCLRLVASYGKVLSSDLNILGWIISAVVVVLLFGRKGAFYASLLSLIITMLAALAGLTMIGEEAGNAMYIFLVAGSLLELLKYFYSLYRK